MSELHAFLADRVLARAELAAHYFRARAEHPLIPARSVWSWVRDGAGIETLPQFVCRHEWSSGLDDTDHETRIYCLRCGLDGDA